MQIVLDFVTGKVGLEEFRQQWYADPTIGQWLDGLVELSVDPTESYGHLPYHPYRMLLYRHYHGSVSELIRVDEQKKAQNPVRCPKWLEVGWYFTSIAAVVVAAYPELKPTKFYDEEADFYMEAQGEYLGGTEVDGLISEILEAYPRSMGKGKRKKEAKAALKAAFHIEGQKFPRWIQEPQWPMGSKSPMQFLGQKRLDERVQFRFRDVDTGEERMVEQLY